MAFRRFPVLFLLFTALATNLHCGGPLPGSFEFEVGGGEIVTTVSGRVATAGGTGVSGATVTAGGSLPAGTPGCTIGGSWSGSGVTDGDGRYSISATSGAGSGRVSVSVSPPTGYLVSPASTSIDVTAGSTYRSVDFTAYRVWSVSGTILDNGSEPLQGVSVAVSGAMYGGATTGSDGRYAATGVAEGMQTVSPSLPGATFTPSSRTVSLSGDVEGVDFVGAFLPVGILGTVTVGGQPLPGAVVSVTGTAVASTTSGATGGYDLGVLPRGSYTVSMTKDGYRPMSSYVTLGISAATVDFDTVPLSNAVYGRVTYVGTGAGLTGVTLSASGPSSSSTATTPPEGAFVLGPLTTGSYTISPSTACPTYIFSPALRSTSLSGTDFTGVDFSASFAAAGTNTVAGRLLDASGSGVAGLTVAASGVVGGNSVTAGDGSYTIGSLHNGAYVVAPSGTGYRFKPSSRAVSLCDNGATAVDFQEASYWSRYGYRSGTFVTMSIAALSDGFIVGGADAALLRLGPYGEFRSGISVDGGGNPTYSSVAAGVDDSFAAVGTGSDNAASPTHATVLRVGSDGAVRWHRSIAAPSGSGASVTGGMVAVAADGGVVVSGTIGVDLFLARFDVDGGLSWAKSYGRATPLAIRADAGGTTVAAWSDNPWRLLLLRVDGAGGVVSARGYSYPMGFFGNVAAAMVGTDCSAVFAGSEGLSRPWALVVGADGDIVWQKSVDPSGSTQEWPVAIVRDGAGRITLVTHPVAGSGGSDFPHFVRFAADGSLVFKKRSMVGGGWPLYRTPRSAVMSGDGRVIVAGSASSYGWVAGYDVDAGGCGGSVDLAVGTPTSTDVVRDDRPIVANDLSPTVTERSVTTTAVGSVPQSDGCE